nr:immunoglobulin light chain junction region [Macaca mulatta]MOV95562.1 immunoglobulin light chain junction region [Macaca mulatta]MOV96997.1 immunoglobulin light chain junction region [Macaca mulatta]MOV97186.1 immunoglobulin light chain junction region [Macaca mulatta]MOV97453.1 immunoglobulin light chain junction region [Macaca mulatta]
DYYCCSYTTTSTFIF